MRSSVPLVLLPHCAALELPLVHHLDNTAHRPSVSLSTQRSRCRQEAVSSPIAPTLSRLPPFRLPSRVRCCQPHSCLRLCRSKLGAHLVTRPDLEEAELRRVPGPIPMSSPSDAIEPSGTAWHLANASASTGELDPLKLQHPALTRPSSVVRVLDAAPLSLPGAALIAAVSFYRARQISGPALTFIDYVQSSKWLKRLLFFVLLKSSNRALNRLVMNRGWNADKPVWSRVRGKGDIVLITGGSTGIGKELVEILAKHTSNIAVLDVSEPTYAASALSSLRLLSA